MAHSQPPQIRAKATAIHSEWSAKILTVQVGTAVKWSQYLGTVRCQESCHTRLGKHIADMIRKVTLSRDGAEAFISSRSKDKWTCRATFVWNVPTHHGGIRLSMLWHRSADSTRTSQDTNGPVFNSVYNLGFKWRLHPLFATFRLIQLPAASPSLPRSLTHSHSPSPLSLSRLTLAAKEK